jgi:hypothetical protein
MRNIQPHALVVLVRSGAELGCWPLVGPFRPDLAMVDGLARSQLTVCRLGCSLELHQASSELKSLLALFGLATTIPCIDAADRHEPRRPVPAVPSPPQWAPMTWPVRRTLRLAPSAGPTVGPCGRGADRPNPAARSYRRPVPMRHYR